MNKTLIVYLYKINDFKTGLLFFKFLILNFKRLISFYWKIVILFKNWPDSLVLKFDKCKLLLKIKKNFLTNISSKNNCQILSFICNRLTFSRFFSSKIQMLHKNKQTFMECLLWLNQLNYDVFNSLVKIYLKFILINILIKKRSM